MVDIGNSDLNLDQMQIVGVIGSQIQIWNYQRATWPLAA
jgi:hypothetical protein